ncbi:MAG: hypothetical protein ACTJLK_04770 [Anaplasma sp.]
MGMPIVLLDDEYAANPLFMAFAIESLGNVRHERTLRRVAVLGDMPELGKDSGTTAIC